MAPGLRLSYWNPRLLRTVYFQLHQQQQAGLFCDVTLQGNGEGLHVHSCVIAACSPYIAKLLTCPGEMSGIVDPSKPILFNRRVIHINGISSHYLLPLVRYMYTSELEVAPADVHGVLNAAKKLQISELEVLKLQGGRLVKPECGRRLNRNCLGSMQHTQYPMADIKHDGLRLGFEAVNAQNNKKCSLNMLKMEPKSQVEEQEEISCRGTQEEELSCRCPPEVEKSNRGPREVKPNCMESVIENEPISQGIAEKTDVLPHSFHCQNKLETVAENQNRGSPKMFPNQEKQLVAVEKQTAAGIKSRKGLMKRLRLDRGRKEAILPDNEYYKPKVRVIDRKNITITSHHQQDDLQFLEASGGHRLPDKTASEENARCLEHLVDSRLRPESIKPFQVKGGTDTAQCINCEMAEPTECTSSVIFNKCKSLEGARREWSDMMTKMENETVNQKSLVTVTQCDSVMGMVYPHDTTINKQGKRSLSVNEPQASDVEKVKLRKIRNGCKWEVVREVKTPRVECSDGREVATPHNECSDGREVETPHIECSDGRKVETPHIECSDGRKVETPHIECSDGRKVETPHIECSDGRKVETPHIECSDGRKVETPHIECSDGRKVETPHIECSDGRKVETPHIECSDGREVGTPHIECSDGREVETPHIECSDGREVETPHIECSDGREVQPLLFDCCDGRDMQFNELGQLLEEILNVPSPMSPIVDVGGCSPVTVIEGVWPDLSLDSDIDVDVVG